MTRILIVEDDTNIARLLQTTLAMAGYESDCCGDGASAIEKVFAQPFDLVLLDVMLPQADGFTVMEKIRSQDVPVIFLTARDTPEDELLAFGVGGDDFIRKPYHSSVLLARLGRLLKDTANDNPTVRGLTLDLPGMKAIYGENAVELTKNEARILWCLMQKELCTRDELIEDLWTNGMYIDGNTLYVNIGRLREKLVQIGAADFIRTVRGVGYRL